MLCPISFRLLSSQPSVGLSLVTTQSSPASHMHLASQIIYSSFPATSSNFPSAYWFPVWDSFSSSAVIHLSNVTQVFESSTLHEPDCRNRVLFDPVRNSFLSSNRLQFVKGQRLGGM